MGDQRLTELSTKEIARVTGISDDEQRYWRARGFLPKGTPHKRYQFTEHYAFRIMVIKHLFLAGFTREEAATLERLLSMLDKPEYVAYGELADTTRCFAWRTDGEGIHISYHEPTDAIVYARVDLQRIRQLINSRWPTTKTRSPQRSSTRKRRQSLNRVTHLERSSPS